MYYKNACCLTCWNIHHLKSDLIHSMTNMRIPGTEPSSVICDIVLDLSISVKQSIKIIRVTSISIFCLNGENVCDLPKLLMRAVHTSKTGVRSMRT